MAEGHAARPSMDLDRECAYPAVWDVQAVFGEYCTRAIRATHEVRLAPGAEALIPLLREGRLFLAPGSRNLPDTSLDLELIECCQTSGHRTFGGLVQEFAGPGRPTVLVATHLVRLLKHGLLSVGPAAPAGNAHVSLATSESVAS